VDSTGVLRSAVTNLLLRSEDFDNASWSKANATITANQIVAPNGLTTADLYTTSANTGVEHYILQTFTAAASTSYTASVYAKAGTSPEFDLQYRVSGAWAGGNVYVSFNLSTQVTTIGGTATASITPVGNGWFRCEITATSSVAGGSPQFRIATVDGAGTIYLWGAQIEQSATVGEYIPTTSTINSAPRFDHNPTTGESLGLLVEEARTNLLLRSEEFDNAYWGKTRSSVTANATTSPAGTLTADKLIEDTTASNSHQLVVSPVTASGIYTCSVYAKAAERTQAAIRLDVGVLELAIFNLSTGTVISTTSGITSSITAVGNGWYRLTATTISAVSVINFVLQIAVGGTNVYTGDGTSGIYFWGAQLEAGAFPTSYIPTTTAAVTRSADVASSTGSAFSSWYRQDEGTLLGAGKSNNPSGNASFLMTVDDGTLANEIAMARRIGSSLATGSMFTLGASQADMFSSAWNTGAEGALALGLSLNNCAISFNGQSPVVDTSATLPAVTTFRLGRRSNTFNTWNGTIRRLTYWPTRLSSEVLQRITQ
jgi:hypothetical protein